MKKRPFISTETLPGGATAYYVGPVADTNSCNCGMPRLPGETGCVNCMIRLVTYLQANALRGDISWDRIVELDRKFIAAGRVVVWHHTPAHVPVRAHTIMEGLLGADS